MNTGIQDAFNLAWKLAGVAKGIFPDKLLDSYSAERSEVGEHVLRDAQNLTMVATVKNPVAQAIRNTISHLMLGLGPVQRAVTDKMSEIVIGYPNSPLNGPAYGGGGPQPGARIAPHAGHPIGGSGPSPRFVLCATPSRAMAGLVERFPALIDPVLHPPLRDDAVWLVRPDGYVESADEATIESYLTDQFET